MLGTDIPSYARWIHQLEGSENAWTYFYKAFVEIDQGARPLTLILLHGLSLLFGQPIEYVLKYLPLVLSPLLVLSVYSLTRIGYPQDRRVAIIAAALTAVSDQIIIGFYAAFYANWMALILMYTSSLFLLRSMQHREKRDIVLFGIITAIILLTHAYTWSYFIAAILFFLVWSILRDRKDTEKMHILIVLLSITLAIIAFDVVRSNLVGSDAGFEKDLSIANSQIGLSEFTNRWINLNAAFRLYLGGYLTNSITISLLFVWSLKNKYNDNFDRILLSIIIVSLLPILFGDYALQSRILYNIPMQLPASIIIYKMYLNKWLGKWAIFALLLSQLTYALRAMANMHLVLPE